MSPAAVTICTSCGGPSVQARRSQLADEVSNTIELSERTPDPASFLKAQLQWLGLLLRGNCTDCVLKTLAETVPDWMSTRHDSQAKP